MLKTYHGSCHCGVVRFEADIDLSNETSKRNCSICTKARFWKTVVAADSFRLLAGEDALTNYQFGCENIHHLFCSRCGVKPLGRGHLEGFGDFVAVNVACLDDATDQEFAEAPVIFQNGIADDWYSAPAETRYL
jgi:hypothetical protein